MIAAVGSRLVIMVFGTLYPAYASYKAVRNKDVKAYVQWMMYWIVFALFTCIETFSDVFLSFWVPFYYEMKVVIVIWLLSPATKGSSLLYRKFVHPTLTEREREIDEYLSKMKERSYSTMLELGSKGINYALQTAIKGGGGLVSQIRKSYSLSDLTDGAAQGEQQPQQQQGPQGRRRVIPPPKLSNHDNEEISDDEMDELPLGGAHRGYSPRRSASGSGRVEMYFPAVDLEVRQRGSTPASDVSHASGRSTTALSVESTDGVDSGLEVEGEPLVRTASLSSTRTSTRVRRPPAHAPGVVTTPSGRKSITAVSEAVAEVDPWGADSDSSPSHSPTISEQVTVVDRHSDPPEQVTEKVQTLEQSLPEQVIENVETLEQSLLEKVTEKVKTSEKNPPEQPAVKQILVEKAPSPDGSSDAVKEESSQALAEEKVEQTEKISDVETNASTSKSKVFDWWPTGDVSPGPIYSTVRENLDKICPLKIVEEDEAVEPLELKVADFCDLSPTEEVQHLEKMTPVRVTVDIKSEQESMHVRLSMESLPTSYQAAEAMDSVIPLVVETYDSESNMDSDSLASVSLPSTPSVSRSSSRLSEGRAGKYNKKPAPPRPEEQEDRAVKGRLVLQPGVVRNLPEAMGDASEVFLRTPKQKRKHKNSGGIAAMIPFFKKESKEDNSNVPKAKLTNL